MSDNEPVIVIGGGQSGLAAARAAMDAGLRPIVLEAGPRPVGSWPNYYDSLNLFSPVEYNALAGEAFPGDRDAYPARDDVVAYLERFAKDLGAEIRTNTRVTSVSADSGMFTVHTADGETLSAAGVVAASGSYSNPHVPQLPGQEGFTGELLHVADYRNPEPYRDKRVVVVGAGNSAVQVAHELALVARATIATRAPLHIVAQRRLGRDLHYWLKVTRLDHMPPAWLARMFTHTLVIDSKGYRAAIEQGVLQRRPMFTGFDAGAVVWQDGTREPVDVVIYATGYRPSVGYLRDLGALGPDGAPLHSAGISTTHPGLVYVGLEFQRSFSSNTLRGVHRDAQYVMRPLAAHIHGASAGIVPERVESPGTP